MSAVVIDNELNMILKLLNSFNHSSIQIQELFARNINRYLHFKMACSICALLYYRLLNQNQRLVAYCILLGELFHGNLSYDNSFHEYFMIYIELTISDIKELLFAYQLMLPLNSYRKEILDIKLSDVLIQGIRPLLAHNIYNEVSSPALRKMYEQEYNVTLNTPQPSNDTSTFNKLFPDKRIFEKFGLYPVNDEPVNELNNQLLLNPILNNDNEIYEIFATAFKTNLIQQQQLKLITHWRENKSNIDKYIFPSNNLQQLIENNPDVAIEFLLALKSNNNKNINEYVNMISMMELSLNCMEIINRLSTLNILTKHLVMKYIINGINSCIAIKDKYNQGRFVKLLCVLILSLLKNEVINVSDITIEVQTFCAEFLRIKEAANLFKLLKSFE